ncbi:ubiquitin carboxyl-terminal hydrolase 44-like [Plakobranchus ocellatus]|uniref:Ubiquitin carboxyl-terminal hydrolase n=1 Tax=Plakobranchus ocellatus TaxID=259542 RepID=A0AAV4E2Q9_9GAST|nr:ubiquitin carboxyl-terminal hydrolase 44-like [Plakobranchus ocellatus]
MKIVKRDKNNCYCIDRLLNQTTDKQVICKIVVMTQADENDRLITAICHHRKSLLGKVLSAWQAFVYSGKKKMSNSTTAIPTMMTRARTNLFLVKKRTLIPGVTGLRNLGNTCYINSILQSLGHLEDFREFFCHLVFGLFSPTGTPVPGSSPNSNASSLGKRNLLRLNTIDFFEHLSNGIAAKKTEMGGTNKSSSSSSGSSTTKISPPQQKKLGGLNGGGCDKSPADLPIDAMLTAHDKSVMRLEQDQKPEQTWKDDEILEAKANALKALSLCQEMHGLLRVLWSGKWAQVSPHGFLQAVWRAIPAFKGHLQHDAQEFLCELLDKMSKEIENLPQCRGLENVIDQSFRGEFVSQVTCQRCSNVSCRYEPFLDVSLEFPRRFQSTSAQIYRNMCHITEMLSSFTDVEDLEPLSYSCEKCNLKRRRSSRQLMVKTDAKKQLLVSKPPEILRLHLKRFRWCGRNNREKIGTHVMFDEELDISPFCKAAPSVPKYRLSAVVVHHGAGFRAGHYTAFVYNNSAGSWLHCNDSRVQLVSLEEVLASQAYILFYTRELATVSLEDLPIPASGVESDKQSNISTLPELDPETLQVLQRGETQHSVDDEVMLSFHRNPVLVKRLSLPTNSSSSTSVPKLTSVKTEQHMKSNSVSSSFDLNALSTEKSRTSSSPPSSSKKSVEGSMKQQATADGRKRQSEKRSEEQAYPAKKVARHKSRSL